jgi:3-oxoacyl-[acyl-carrier protein] reductase
MMPSEFQGKVVVVTGGSRGIGREIAVEFARGGAQTVVVSSSPDNLAAATKTIAAAGGPAPLSITADLRKLDGVQQVFKTVKEKFNRCDILVNSAGATKAGNFVDLPDEAWMDGYALKLFGCVRMCRAFWPMLKAANGFVVNIGGGAARSPGADFSIGASVNAAMGNFSKALSQQGKKDGVNVNVIHPGATDTERFGELLDMRSRASGKSIDQLRAEATTKDGIRRIGTPQDVAGMTLFLCSEKARHIQGTAIAVDGGATVGYY